jgi:hypothetical protein
MNVKKLRDELEQIILGVHESQKIVPPCIAEELATARARICDLNPIQDYEEVSHLTAAELINDVEEQILGYFQNNNIAGDLYNVTLQRLNTLRNEA